MRISIWVYGVGLLVGAALSSLDSFLVGLPVHRARRRRRHDASLRPPGRDDARRAPRARSPASSASRGRSAPSLGPIVVGVAIDLLGPYFPATNGYGAMWVAIGAPILLSLPFLAAIRREEPEAEPALEQARRRGARRPRARRLVPVRVPRTARLLPLARGRRSAKPGGRVRDDPRRSPLRRGSASASVGYEPGERSGSLRPAPGPPARRSRGYALRAASSHRAGKICRILTIRRATGSG